jgi:membrane-associated phospholipid phosphatase
MTKSKSINFIFVSLLGIYSLLFLLWPEADILVSIAMKCQHTCQACHFLCHTIKIWMVRIFVGIFIFYGLKTLYLYLKYKGKSYQNSLKDSIFIFFNLTVCALLVEIIKKIFSRPRPISMKIFGGTNEYIKIFYISDLCNSNCSFPSGDVIVGALCFPLLYAITKRPYLSFYLSLIPLILFGYCRIALTRHFLSDVIFSTLIVYWLTFLSLSIIYKGNK